VSAQGAFTFILHGHLPYMRLPGPFGEVTTYEVTSETYVPLLQALYNLKDAGVKFNLTISLTPVTVEQFTDHNDIENFDRYLDEKIAAARHDSHTFSPDDDPHLHYLAGWYANWYTQIKTAYNERFGRNLTQAFRQLQDEGYIEIATSAATHAYLPLLGHESAIRGQIKTAIHSYERAFGRRPTAMWLPAAGYRRGLEALLADEGFKVFFSEPHMIGGGKPIGVAAGDVLGPYNTIKQLYSFGQSEPAPLNTATTRQVYRVSNSNVAVIGRDDRTTMQVWGSRLGYPGDVDYRESQRISSSSGLNYWRVTGERVDPHDKDLYHPDWATYKVDQHAEHFAHLVGDMMRSYQRDTGQFGLIAAIYDVRLFGHWWFEGSRWMEQVLRHLATTPDIELTSASRFIEEHPPQSSIQLAEGSWGVGGGHFIWDNPETRWLWQHIHEAEARMEKLAGQFENASEDERFVLNQAARELMLMQSSDWPVMMMTRRDRRFAIQQFNRHLERFERLAASLEARQPDRELADAFWAVDYVFAELDYRAFAR
jgi:1,4-alpha-glucan branching enzyme